MPGSVLCSGYRLASMEMLPAKEMLDGGISVTIGMQDL